MSRQKFLFGAAYGKEFLETSSTGSATLGDTSCAKLVIQLGPSNTSCKLELYRFSTLLVIQDRAECGKEVGTLHRKMYTGRGGHCTHLSFLFEILVRCTM